MRRLAIAVIVAAFAGSASLVAALGPSCCACIPSGGAQASGFMNRTAVNALFCAQAPPANPGDLSVQCQQENPDYTLYCVPDLPTLACASELADAGIGCPTSGVPAATGSTALALALVLAAAGALVLRRRRGVDA